MLSRRSTCLNLRSALATQGWTNGPDKMTCDHYARLWCENGDARPGQEWAVDGPRYRQPRLNCCVCGKKGCNSETIDDKPADVKWGTVGAVDAPVEDEPPYLVNGSVDCRAFG